MDSYECENVLWGRWERFSLELHNVGLHDEHLLDNTDMLDGKRANYAGGDAGMSCDGEVGRGTSGNNIPS